MDVGTDAALAMTANAFVDYRSARQQPCIWGGNALIGLYTTGETIPSLSNAVCSGIYFFGFDILGTTVTRNLTGKIWLRSSSGAAAYARATLSRVIPTNFPRPASSIASFSFSSPMFLKESSQSDIFTTTSTTWGETAEFSLNIAAKDLVWGTAWLVLEVSGDAECRGFSKLVQGPRTAP